MLSSLDLKGIAEHIKCGRARKIVVLCGAGISTSAGIPGEQIVWLHVSSISGQQEASAFHTARSTSRLSALQISAPLTLDCTTS